MCCGGGDPQGRSYPAQEGLQQVGPPGGSPASHTLSHLPCGNHRGLPGQLHTQCLTIPCLFPSMLGGKAVSALSGLATPWYLCCDHRDGAALVLHPRPSSQHLHARRLEGAKKGPLIPVQARHCKHPSTTLTTPLWHALWPGTAAHAAKVTGISQQKISATAALPGSTAEPPGQCSAQRAGKLRPPPPPAAARQLLGQPAPQPANWPASACTAPPIERLRVISGISSAWGSKGCGIQPSRE